MGRGEIIFRVGRLFRVAQTAVDVLSAFYKVAIFVRGFIFSQPVYCRPRDDNIINARTRRAQNECY